MCSRQRMSPKVDSVYTTTHYRSSLQGLLTREEQGAPTSLRTRPLVD